MPAGPTARERMRITRRRLVGAGATGLGVVVVASCVNLAEGGFLAAGGFGMAGNSEPGRRGETVKRGRLQARPGPRAGDAPPDSGGLGAGLSTGDAAPGVHALGLEVERDGLLYVPAGYRADRPAPLVLALHGAGGTPQRGLNPLQSLADDAGLLLLAPASRGRTWDVILSGYGPDVEYVNRALAWTFARYTVDRERLVASGFSDGASYAISLGAANGDLFTHVVAFSPGFAVLATRQGSPRSFVSHGTQDTVLPIDSCSRRLVPILRLAGYDVRYDEFEGPHAVPPGVARTAVDWLLSG
jgi:phospholipase/carboxylesterase